MYKSLQLTTCAVCVHFVVPWLCRKRKGTTCSFSLCTHHQNLCTNHYTITILTRMSTCGYGLCTYHSALAVQKKEREEAAARPSTGSAFVPPSKRAAGQAPPAARGRDEVGHCFIVVSCGPCCCMLASMLGRAPNHEPCITVVLFW